MESYGVTIQMKPPLLFFQKVLVVSRILQSDFFFILEILIISDF